MPLHFLRKIMSGLFLRWLHWLQCLIIPNYKLLKRSLPSDHYKQNQSPFLSLLRESFLSDFGVNIRTAFLFPSSLHPKSPRAVYGPRATEAWALVTLWKTSIILRMPSRVLCGHHLLRAWTLMCCWKREHDCCGSSSWEAMNLEGIRAVFQKWEQGGFYQDRTAKLFSVRTYPVHNNRERIGLTVGIWLSPEIFGNKVHLRPFHWETLQMLASPSLCQSSLFL